MASLCSARLPGGSWHLCSLLVLLLGSAVVCAQPGPGSPSGNGVLMLPPLDSADAAAQEKLPAPRVVPSEAGPAKVLTSVGPGPLLALPTAAELFQVESEAAFRQRLRSEFERQRVLIEFPKENALGVPVRGVALRPSPPCKAVFVPSFLCYRPLYFEDRNTQRYGWTVPFAQPLLSAGRFYLDTALLPYSMLMQPPWSWECSGGGPRPGDPVPYFFYLTPSSPRAQNHFNSPAAAPQPGDCCSPP